jgi:hypothetical protein
MEVKRKHYKLLRRPGILETEEKFQRTWQLDILTPVEINHKLLYSGIELFSQPRDRKISLAIEFMIISTPLGTTLAADPGDVF